MFYLSLGIDLMDTITNEKERRKKKPYPIHVGGVLRRRKRVLPKPTPATAGCAREPNRRASQHDVAVDERAPRACRRRRSGRWPRTSRRAPGTGGSRRRGFVGVQAAEENRPARRSKSAAVTMDPDRTRWPGG